MNPKRPRHGRSDPKLVAFYLPQFHPIAENDRHWGKGYTEWTACRARETAVRGPLSAAPAGRARLQSPVAQTRRRQAELARDHGLFGFCYHYYWFGGRRLLERPLQEMLSSGEPDFPFCVCWANEHWTRRWDGAEQQTLVEQPRSSISEAALIEELIPIFRDRRYIRIGDAPLLIVYRPESARRPGGDAESLAPSLP